MLQKIKGWLQKIKVWGFRKYYRWLSARGWKDHIGPANWGALEIPGDAGPIHGRIFPVATGGDKPLIVYFHGGGWVIGDVDTHTPLCQALSQLSGCTVISVDYRLAPEHPFPAASQDCLAATRWIAQHIGDFGSTNHKLVVAGDSAGGHLAACTCLEIDSEIRQQIAGEILIYPVTDHYSAGFRSYIDKAKGQTLTANMMHWFWDTYLGACPADSIEAARAYPLRSDRLDSLPPTLLVTAEDDPLRDEGIAFGDKLRDADVPLQYRHFDNAAHGFAGSEGYNPNLVSLLEDIAAWIDQLD